MIIAGLDFSYTSPAVVIFDGKEYRFYGFRSKKKQDSNNKLITLLDYPELYKSQTERFDKLTDVIYDILYKNNVTEVFLEGYAYGAHGSVFDLGEATGLMKWKLMKAEIPFQIVAPTVVKKFASGKGNCSKHVMLEFFCQQSDHGINISTDLDCDVTDKKIGKPLDDLVDAYWLCKFGVNNFRQH